VTRLAGTGLDVAIVGLACRFAGAGSAGEFWDALTHGVELVRELSRQELVAAGVPSADLDRPAYVRRRGALDGVDRFAASFFGYTPREAETMDPQHRLLLECAWEALEDAGCDPERTEGPIGVFATAGANAYRQQVDRHAALVRATGTLQVDIGSKVDYLATTVSYKLGLRGPSMSVQTACSSSLVAVHLACQSLTLEECDLALAGGAAIQVPLAGTVYREGGVTSPDGRCRAFDAGARGTVGGDGVGVVVLKRLAEAVADGDHVYAVIRGSAVNNDGASRVGFAAPGARGQAEVVVEAQALAGVEPRTIGYVEAHGIGTALGDPIEVRALTRAFATGTRDRGFCALGSVKTNVGHLDVAAGMAGLIKAALALHHRQIPPTLHFETPNPACELEAGPFHVNTGLVDWAWPGHPRRAGVSAFGIGGTNAHVVLEEAPEREPARPARPGELLLLSARTATALDRMTAGLGTHLAAHPEQDLADVAHTLRIGRQRFDHRRALVCGGRDEAVRALADLAGVRARQPSRDRSVVFLLPDAGAPGPVMTQGLYRDEPVYRRWVDRCRELLPPASGQDRTAQFITAYALARTWMAWGVTPRAVIGDTVAACLAGVLSLEAALRMVAAEASPARLSPPRLPWVSSMTGEFVTAAEHWSRSGPARLRSAVAAALRDDESCVLLAVGPGPGGLHELADGHEVVPPMPRLDRSALLEALARLWLAGVTIDWGAYDETERRWRLSLPSYPFERQRYWVGPPVADEVAAGVESAGEAAPSYLRPEGLRPEGLRPYVPPEGQLQARVAAIWEDVIGIGQVGATDDFYELGGNSLVAVQALARLQEAFDVDLPPRLLLGRPNVAGVAARIEELLLTRPR
jgi:acyl transferase domain-containing protein/acyl carrier protein